MSGRRAGCCGSVLQGSWPVLLCPTSLCVCTIHRSRSCELGQQPDMQPTPFGELGNPSFCNFSRGQKCCQNRFYIGPRLGPDLNLSAHGPVNNKRTVPSWVGWQPDLFRTLGGLATLTCHAPMCPQKRQVAVLGRALTKSRAEHIGVCAVARGIHRSFWSAIRLRTEEGRSARMDTRSYLITTRDARKTCRLRATCRRLRATLERRQGAMELRAHQGGCKFSEVDLTVAPRSFFNR
jgi:hypothetical protein